MHILTTFTQVTPRLKGLVIGFGYKERLGRMCNSVCKKCGHTNIPETKCVPDWNLWHWSHWQSCNPGNLGPVPDQISCRAAEKYVCHQMKRKPSKLVMWRFWQDFFEENSLGICCLHSFCSKTYKLGTYIKSKLRCVFWKNYFVDIPRLGT